MQKSGPINGLMEGGAEWVKFYVNEKSVDFKEKQEIELERFLLNTWLKPGRRYRGRT